MKGYCPHFQEVMERDNCYFCHTKDHPPQPAENCSELAHLPCFRIAYYLGVNQK